MMITEGQDRLDNIVIARLMSSHKDSTPNAIAKHLEPLLGATGQPVRQAVEAAVARLRDAGLIAPVMEGKKPLRLTSTGEEAGKALLGDMVTPGRIKWDSIKKTYLAALALGIRFTAKAQIDKFRTNKTFQALLLKRRFDLPLPEQPTLTQAVNTLTAKLVKARRADVQACYDPVLRDWLTKAVTVAEPTSEPDTPVQLATLEQFAAAVLDAARAAPTGRVGTNRMFIAHAWRQFHQRHPHIAEAAFRQRLIEANNKLLLHLARADLVLNLDPADVRASELTYQNAVFHFICI